MHSYVIDSSVLLALLKKEPGSENYYDYLKDSVISSVNITEVAGILIARHDIPKDKVIATMSQLVGTVINFSGKQAYIAADLEKTNMQNKLGLSLGDKACISLGILMNLTVCSTDRIWGNVKVENLKINLLR